MPAGYVAVFTLRDADNIKQWILLLGECVLQGNPILFSQLCQNDLH